MSLNWSWQTCLTWSDRIFLMISDGRLPAGWTDNYAIKDVQRDICLVGTRAKIQTSEPKNRDFKERQPYDKDYDGIPCSPWNEGKTCGLNFSHGELPNKSCHFCAWCVLKFKKANSHRECDCNNKRRWTVPNSLNSKVF